MTSSSAGRHPKYVITGALLLLLLTRFTGLSLAQDRATITGDTLRIYFANGKSETGTGAAQLIQQFLLQYHAGDTILVTGYADEPGTAQQNKTLAAGRAATATRLLRNNNIPAAVIRSGSSSGTTTAKGARDKDRRADIVIRKTCAYSDGSGQTLDIRYPFNSIDADNCALHLLAKMSGQLDVGDGIQLRISSYHICPVCLTDSTIPPAYHPLLEAADMQEQRRKAIANYLQTQNADMVKVYYDAVKICFKEHKGSLKDSSSIAALIAEQRRVIIRLKGL